MAQIFRYTLPFCSNDLRLIEEAVERVMNSSRYPCERSLVRDAVAAELRHGAPVMFRLVKAGHRACDAALREAVDWPPTRLFREANSDEGRPQAVDASP